MVEKGGGGTSFPVMFYDGEREINIGSVNINPSLEYKPFQHMLSQKIGISPNQISIYLLERKRIPNSSFYEERRRMPITGKVNFASVCRMKDCCFLAVLKRSRKSRIRRDRASMNAVDFADYSLNQDFHPQPMNHPVGDNLVLLRRNQELPFYDHISTAELNDFNGRLQSNNLMVQRENYDFFPIQRVNDLNYEMAMAKNGNLSNFGFDPNLNVGLDPFPALGDSYGALTTTNMTMMMNNTEPEPWCEVCLRENKEQDSTLFHSCINDVVIEGFFKSRAGPIKRLV